MAKGYKIVCSFLLTLVAICTVLLIMYFRFTYVVKFDSKGGTKYPEVKVHIGEKVIKPHDPLMEGYIFVGWYTNDNQLFDFDTPIKEDTIIIAAWQAIS